jgi:hypothetical protein
VKSSGRRTAVGVGDGVSFVRWRGEDLGSGRSWCAVKSSGRRTAVGGEMG